MGRRTFLKQTGMASAGTAIALHGFRLEVLASDSGPENVTTQKVRWWSTGSVGGRVTIPNNAGFSNPPTESEIATWINANPSLVTSVGNGLSPILKGKSTTTQNYLNPSPGTPHEQTTYVIPTISTTDISGPISVAGGFVSFSVGAINFRSVTVYNWSGTAQGTPVTTNDPNPPLTW